MNLKQVSESICLPLGPDTTGQHCCKWMGLVCRPPCLFTMMPWGHVTRFRPPDWLLPCIVVSRGTAGIVKLFSFPLISPMAAEAM